ncbi:MAG: macro domain-containing protein, partial [Nitrospiraceae bacterium]
AGGRAPWSAPPARAPERKTGRGQLDGEEGCGWGLIIVLAQHAHLQASFVRDFNEIRFTSDQGRKTSDEPMGSCARQDGGMSGERIQISVVQGSILDADVPVIVNAANSLGIMGGGVAGVIKRVARVWFLPVPRCARIVLTGVTFNAKGALTC